MTGSPLRDSHARYQELVAGLRSRASWELDETANDPADVIAAVAEGETAVGELFFKQIETGSRITLRFPEVKRGGVAELLLDDPLDHRLDPAEDGFAGQLCRAHARIAEEYATPYLNAVADPSLLATVRIPSQYDDDLLDRTLDALDVIAVEVNQLHDEIERALDPYLERTDAVRADTSDGDWVYLGTIHVDETGEITLPKEIFSAGVLDSDVERVHWSYDPESGGAVLASGPTEGYESVDTGALRADGSSCSLRVPPRFRPENRDVADGEGDSDAERIGVRRHLVCRENGGGARVAYLLTDTQLRTRLDGLEEPYRP